MDPMQQIKALFRCSKMEFNGNFNDNIVPRFKSEFYLCSHVTTAVTQQKIIIVVVIQKFTDYFKNDFVV